MLQRSEPRRWDAAYLPLEAAEQSPFSSGCRQLLAAPAAWQTGAGSAASAQAARAEAGHGRGPGPGPRLLPGSVGGGKGQVGGCRPAPAQGCFCKGRVRATTAQSLVQAATCDVAGTAAGRQDPLALGWGCLCAVKPLSEPGAF